MFDIVIRGGTVVDGSGGPSGRADVGIVGDRIAAIGRIRERGVTEIDADGHLVTPGFFEIHTHMDAQLFWDALGTCSSWHGITSAVLGNCGFTLAPCAPADADLCLRSLERAEDMSRDVLKAGLDWTWDTYPEYLDAVDRAPKGINYAGLIGHSPLRTWVMGERAFEEPATDDEIEQMRRQVAAALDAGAIGFSTSLLDGHRTSDDKPVASRMSTWDELRALVCVMTDKGVGMFELANSISLDPEERAAYNERLGELAIECGRPVTFACPSTGFDPGLGDQYLELADRIAPQGGRIVGQVSSREFGSLLGFQTNLPMHSLPGWRRLKGMPLAQLRVVLSDPDERDRLVEEALKGEYREGVGAEPRPPVWDRLRVFAPDGSRGESLSEIAAARGTSEVEAMIDIALDRNFDVFFIQPSANLDFDRVLTLLRHPRTVIGLSDSGAHVSQILDTSIPTHFLAYWVRQREEFTWEEGVRKLTADPAALAGFNDRGMLREGLAADIAVLDPATIGPGHIEAANDLPAGGLRLRQKASGLKATVVNGEVLLRDGEHTGALPGRLLRGSLARRG